MPAERIVRGDGEYLFGGVEYQEHSDESRGVGPSTPCGPTRGQPPTPIAGQYGARPGTSPVTHGTRPFPGSPDQARPAATGSATRLISWYSSSALTWSRSWLSPRMFLAANSPVSI